MMNIMKSKKGFTLIEILIVVVILGILASMILPRLMAQTERAVIAEAQQMLGAIRTAQTRTQDLAGNAGYLQIDACGSGTACVDAQWTAIGMTAPTGGAFTYGCVAGTTLCTATRVGTARAGNTITLNQAGAWGCGGAGNPVYVPTVPISGGCQ